MFDKLNNGNCVHCYKGGGEKYDCANPSVSINRGIKFRAWVKPLGCFWFCKQIFTRYQYGFVTSESNGGGGDENLKPKDFVLQQFTGCQDYKDNDIYEGDIVLLDGEEKLPVVFRDGAFVLEDENADYCNLGPVSYCCEVIGNIFEGEYERN